MPKVEPFEKHTSMYEKWFEENNYVYLSEVEALKKLVPRSGEGIEIGVGTGRFALPLAIKLGLDPSKKMLGVARQRGIQPVLGVAEKLPLADARFDFAVMVTTVCFLDDVRAAFAEVIRVLKPGGCFIIGFVDRNSVIGKKYREHQKDSEFYKIADFFSVSQLTQLLKGVGFKDFAYFQTIFKDLSDINSVEPVKQGFGQGSFVVVRGTK